MGLYNKLKSHRGRTAAIVLFCLALCVPLLNLSSTGSYFSDSHPGSISGQNGRIQVTPGSSTVLSFANPLQPGEPQSVTLQYTNTGNSRADVWLTFPNATALSALNNFGSYAEVHVKSGSTAVFDSANLNDRLATCHAFSPSGCWPLPSQLELASNVAPNATRSFTFTFGYAAKMSTPEASSSWLPYPVLAGQYSATNPNGQTTVNASDGTGYGLPYTLVATQVGQTP